MQLKHIDKSRYRKHLNLIIGACIVSLIVGSLLISQILIALFPHESGRHFYWNLLGVIASGAIIGGLLNKYRTHHTMTEVVYVWELKQALNKVNRKLPKIKTASESGNVNALLALQFCYAGSRQLWQLDDNMITMDELAIQQAQLDALAARFNVSLNADDYRDTMLQAL